jgi:hypothetical protein
MKKKRFIISTLCVLSLMGTCQPKATAQTEVMAWGNITGIRVEGELMEFESSFRVVGKNRTTIDFTGRERHSTQYTHEGVAHVVKSSVQRVRFEQRVEDRQAGIASVAISYESDTTLISEGAYYCFKLPAKPYANGRVQTGSAQMLIADAIAGARKTSGRKIVIDGEGRKLQLDFASNVTAFLHNEQGNAVLYIQLIGGNLKKGQKGQLNFTLTATGNIDHSPAEITVDRENPGRLFLGLGGNFRLQNAAHDPQVIDYCLKNMRVAFGRVEMPWKMWQPEENSDPIANARAGKLLKHVEESMQMAQNLGAQGMPVIVSAWFPPDWAVLGNPNASRGRGIAAHKLDPAKAQKIYKSLTDYLVYLKQAYGVEAYAFSFNESDIGIDVLHTAEEHAVFIKELGAYMSSRGLTAKVLLGDNSDATSFDFILPALNDPATHKYIAAVSFHSWRGCDDETLRKWAGAARQLNVPLLIGEGSTDAAAWRYPQILLEPAFALYEINLYIRIASICQPLSILQWQLTSDYSLLWGGGIFRSEGPLRPTQRFWNLKQLASTPENVFALPFTCNREEVNCAAFGNISRNEYAVHIVNNGAARKAVVKGLPDLRNHKIYVTNQAKSMDEIAGTKNADGSISIDLPPTSFVSLTVK